ncbi:MAG TPA: hypothetical protein VF606_02150, partial [Geminicoccaceae bacterium]
ARHRLPLPAPDGAGGRAVVDRRAGRDRAATPPAAPCRGGPWRLGRVARSGAAAFALLAALAVAAARGRLGREDPALADEAAFEQGPPIPYRVEFEGAAGAGAGPLPAGLASLLPRVSRAQQLTKEPPSSELVIRRRALDDVPRLEAALRAEGYYAGKVEPDVRGFAGDGGDDGAAPADEPRTVLVVFRIDPGPLYRQGALRIEAGAGGVFQPPRPDELGLKTGEPARAQAVLDAERELLRRARKAGHALAKPGRRSTVVDGETRTMDVTLRL